MIDWTRQHLVLRRTHVHPSHPARIQQSPGALFPPHLQWKTVSPAEICTAIVSFTEPTVTTSVNITSKCLHMKKRKVLLYHTKQSDYLAAVNNPSTIVLLPSPQITQESLSSLSTIIQPKDSFSIVLDGIPRSETLLSILSRLPSFSLTSIRVLPSSNIQPTFLHNLHAANHPRSNFQLCVLEFLTLDELDRCYKHLLRTPLYPSASIVSPSMPAHDKEEATVHPNFSFFPPLDTLSQTDLQNPTVPPFPDPDSLRLPLDGLRNQLELALTPLHFSNDTQSGASGSSHYFQPSPDPYCYF
ncbi:hypothetical protein BLNAU_4164 [Blattamonas nauphoetae]|uniref:Uncharacterized protein n=1 Tax=Blattamonas nauphoetae TaxID=2049346 RepID=A0ABQ9YAF7_9EUKA|nr:hypothetical protein BLNAU_4164 [Blattamonas nauphoetae]